MKILKNIAYTALVLIMFACVSQNKQPSVNNKKKSGPQGRQPSVSQLLSEMDSNKDGKLAKSEAKGPIANDFSNIDTNNDGFLSETELKNTPTPQRGGQRQ
ncbi:hypothetical protein [Chondrinema litorale]|uniref:hypothetical protein n=1 Tax=Chondrinema litorale TaxID=2994555 RepID=UPI00254287C8|nr:hypothetical protein [Chondrinema litorale]UZR98959.1 hypothetical protein OQ292_34480 [Chondrinema litorale]